MIHRKSLLRSATVPAALMLALPAAAGAQQDEYAMKLTPAAATVAAGRTTVSLITFQAPGYLLGTRVKLGATDLPAGVSVAFYPPTPKIGATSVLTLSTASSSPAGLSSVAITALTISSDPIGTATTFTLTIS